MKKKLSLALILGAALATSMSCSLNTPSPSETNATPTPHVNGGVVTTLAGSTTSGHADETGTAASFYIPCGVAVDGSGNIYVADTNNNMIRKITPGGVVTTLAGSTTSGHADGTGAAASFNNPMGVAVDGSGNIYVADTDNNMIRKITPDGAVTTLAGSGAQGHADGTGTAASFTVPTGIAVDSSGNVYVADFGNSMLRKVIPGGVVTTLAGSTTSGHADGTGTAASFFNPRSVVVDTSGNLYVADCFNNMIRKITSGGVVTTLAGSTASGHADGTGATASFNHPYGVGVDSSGNVYVAEYSNNMIREITPGGVVTTLAGSTASGHADGTGVAASFYYPNSLAVDGSGNVYVADSGNNMIRKIQ